MNPMRQKVEVYAKVEGLNELKETINIDDLIASPFANIIPQTGKMQNQQVNTILTNITHKIEINYSRTIAEAYQNEQTKSSMFIMYKGHRFDITYIINPFFHNRTLEIFTEERLG